MVFMAGWMAVNLDYLDQGGSILEQVELRNTSGSLKYHLCREQWWDYVVETGEWIYIYKYSGTSLWDHIRTNTTIKTTSQG